MTCGDIFQKAVKFIKPALPVLWLCGFFLLFGGVGANSQSLPLDDKARYEKSLEEKVEEILLKLLGPNQAKVVVQASMDFTRTEKFDVTSSSESDAERNKAFKWGGNSGEVQPFNNYLLPGFPSPDSGSSSDARSYQRQMLFPTSFVKKLSVTVIVNKTMTEPEIQNVRTVVSEILELNQTRGDTLSMIKTAFAPIWKTIWYSPEALNLVFKYGILTIMGIVAMIVVSIGFLKLAAAMNTMAKAQQSHQITMDLGKGAMGGAAGLPGGQMSLGISGKETMELLSGEKKEAEGGGGGDIQQEVVFNVRPDQVDFLVTLMAGEDPSNVALVTSHLESAIRSDFLNKLPPDMSSEVISHMASVRFVEAEVIDTIKEELEKKLGGAVGGVGKVLEALDKVSLRAKKSMLDKLAKKHPDIAAKVRAKVFLTEDLARLSDRDISVLVSSIKMEELSVAVCDLPAVVKDKIKAQMTEKSWQMVEQTMKYGMPSGNKIEEAVENLVSLAIKLIREGRIANPLSNPSPRIEDHSAVPGPEAKAGLLKPEAKGVA